MRSHYIISYDVVSYGSTSYVVISYDIISFDNMSCDTISHEIIWYDVALYDTTYDMKLYVAVGEIFDARVERGAENICSIFLNGYRCMFAQILVRKC